MQGEEEKKRDERKRETIEEALKVREAEKYMREEISGARASNTERRKKKGGERERERERERRKKDADGDGDANDDALDQEDESEM